MNRNPKLVVFIVMLALPLLYNNCAEAPQGGRSLSPENLAELPSEGANTEDDSEMDLSSTLSPTMNVGQSTSLIWNDEFTAFSDQWSDRNSDQSSPGFLSSRNIWYPIPTTMVEINEDKMHMKSGACDNPNNVAVCGSEISTRQGFNSFVHGHIEIRVQFPANANNVSGFWLMGNFEGAGNEWPNNGEIDIALFRDLAVTNPTAHLRWSGVDCGSICRVNFEPSLGIDYRQGYHVWSITRTSDLLEVYVDGQLYMQYTRAEAMAVGGNYQVIFDGPMYIRTRNNSDRDQTLPAAQQDLIYDYIRAWSFN